MNHQGPNGLKVLHVPGMEIRANTEAKRGGFACKKHVQVRFWHHCCLVSVHCAACSAPSCSSACAGTGQERRNLLPRKNTGQMCKEEGNCKIQNPSTEPSSSDHAHHVMGFFREITHNGLCVSGEATVPRHNFIFHCLAIVATCGFVFQRASFNGNHYSVQESSTVAAVYKQNVSSHRTSNVHIKVPVLETATCTQPFSTAPARFLFP